MADAANAEMAARRQQLQQFNQAILEKLKGGDPAAAEQQARQALAAFPNHPTFATLLALSFAEQGRRSEAIDLLRKVTQAAPKYASGWLYLGLHLKETQDLDGALAAFQTAVELEPNNASALTGLGITLLDQGESSYALAPLQQATRLEPKRLDAGRALVKALMDLLRFKQALAICDNIRALDPEDVVTETLYGVCLAGIGKEEEAKNVYLTCAQRLNLARQDHQLCLLDIASQLVTIGAMEEAEAQMLRVPKESPYYIGVLGMRAALRKITPDDPIWPELRACVEQERQAKEPKKRIFFDLAKAYADTGDYDNAFKLYDEGNKIIRAQTEYNESETEKYYEKLRRTFTPEAMTAYAGAGLENDRLPIFITGMPRSGTTLVEQIIQSHPEVTAGGETSYVQLVLHNMKDAEGNLIDYPTPLLDVLSREHIRLMAEMYRQTLQGTRPDASRITDKMPLNCIVMPVLDRMFPRAPILYCQRNPVDCCLSNFQETFMVGNEWSYDMETMGRFYRMVSDLVAHWLTILAPGRVFTVTYEALVADPESHIRKILDYCGLSWDDRCLNFHETKNPVRTASVRQVRMPLYKTSVERWRRYEKHLIPMLRALGPYAPAPSGNDSID